MYLTIIFLPILSSILALFFGRFLGEKGSSFLSVILMFTSFLLSLISFFLVGLKNNPCFFKIAPWFDSGLFFVSWGFLFDSLTVIMLVVVTCVSSIVHLYSIEYMHQDPHKARFMGYLSLFTFFMLVLVSSDNFIQMFIGWEGIGLSSYILINFWFTRIQANKAAIQAMLVNRVGDFALSLGIFGIFLEFKSVDYLTVFASVPLVLDSNLVIFGFGFNSINLICILLFIGAGSVIHAINDEQDLRRMGGLVNIIPFTYSMIFIGSIAITGLPFISGFYSKDVILEVAYAKYTLAGHFSFWIGSLGAFFTAFYSLRLLYLTFLCDTNSHYQIIKNSHDAPFLMSFPLIILSFGSLFVGYITKDLIIGLGTPFWGNSIFIHPNHSLFVEAEFIPQSIKLLPIILSLLGAISSFTLFTFYSEKLFFSKISYLGKSFYTFLNRKWFFDKVYNDFIIQPSIGLSFHSTYKIIDRGLLELLGPLGISNTLYSNALVFSRLQTGFVYHYTFVIFIGFCIFLSFIFYDFVFDIRVVILFFISFFLYKNI
jgi:NADH-ubiquinone oxidoreductase chain 5